MRKNMQRIMSLMLVLLLLIPSLAIAQANIDIDYIQNGNDVTVNIKGVRNRPASITIEDESRYYYIDQGITDDLGKIQFSTSLDVGKSYNCQVNIDGKVATKKIIVEKSDIDPEPGKPEPTEPEVAHIYIKGYKGIILDESNVEIKRGDTVLSFTKRILDRHNISYEDRSGYIASIDGQGEFDKGPDSGWMYSVNGKFPDVGAGQVRINNGDNISWLYTYDLGKDIGNPYGRGDSSGGTTSDIIDRVFNTVNHKNVSQERIGEAIDEVTKYFKDKTAIELKPEELKFLLADGSKTTQILLISLQKAKTQELVEKIANSSIEITQYLGKLIDNKMEHNIIEEIGTISRENIGIALEAVNKLEDKSKANKIIDSMLQVSAKIEKELSKITLKPNKLCRETIAIKVVEKEENKNNIVLPQILIEKAMKQNIDNIKILSNLGQLEIVPNFVGRDIGEDVNINITKQTSMLNIEFKLGDKVISQFEKPIKITFPYDKLVTHKNKITTILVKKGGMKESTGGVYDENTKTVKFLTNRSGSFTIEEGAKEFKDISKHKWAEEAVESMAVKGIIDGRTTTKFDPTSNITRAEFAALVSRMLKYQEGSSEQIPFQDVSNNKWYYSSVAAVYENGLISGKSPTSFDPDGYITREEVAKIIGKILEKNSYKKQDKIELDKFNDGSSIASWAQEGAAIAVYNGIIEGSEGKFMPKQNATRAETAVMLYRLYDLIMD